MRQRTVDMLRDLSHFERRYPGIARKIASSDGKAIVALARIAGPALAYRGVFCAELECYRDAELHALNLQFAMDVRDAALISGDPAWRALLQ